MFFHRDIAEGPPSLLRAMPSAQPTAHHETGAFSNRVTTVHLGVYMLSICKGICFVYAILYPLYMLSISILYARYMLSIS